MREELIEAFQSLRFNNDVRAVILTGAGTNFCAGADIDKMADQDLRDRRDRLQGLSQTLVRNAYSRRFELEADREAVATLRRWNRPPEAFFSILDKLERERGATKLPSILLTHPSNQEREARARAGLRSLPP